MKKTMNLKRIISLFAVVVLMFSFLTVTASAGTVSDAKSSVVMIENAPETGRGSGFAIGEVGKPVQYIVTNAHVVDKDNVGYTTATVYFDKASNDYVTANVYFYDRETDVAVLKLPQPTNKRSAMVLCPMQYVDTDEEFAALGYPGGQLTDWEKFNLDDITVTKGGIKKSDRLNGQDIYLLDLEITNGNSGGPLVNSKGEVVGINTIKYQVGEFAENNVAIAIDELLKVIDTGRIPVTLHGSINWFLVAGGVVLVLIIALVIVLIVRKKNNNGDDNYAGTNYTMPIDNGVNHVTPKQTSAAGKTTARVIAIGGTLNGKRYSVSGTAKIGRDSSKCAIAFPVNTQGVSGIHCEVGFDGSVCYVNDLNSSYGTFTVDGRKLTPNVPQVLRSGEKFYLASPENMFEVRF